MGGEESNKNYFSHNVPVSTDTGPFREGDLTGR